MRAFQNAAGPNFGTYAFGALILSLVNLMRRMARGRNILSIIVSLLLACLGRILHIINSFAVVG